MGGWSVGSAIPHTPASGPFALVRTPPISSLSIATVEPFLCWAWVQVKDTAKAPTITSKHILRCILMCSSRADGQLGILQLGRAYTEPVPLRTIIPLLAGE